MWRPSTCPQAPHWRGNDRTSSETRVETCGRFAHNIERSLRTTLPRPLETHRHRPSGHRMASTPSGGRAGLEPPPWLAPPLSPSVARMSRRKGVRRHEHVQAAELQVPGRTPHQKVQSHPTGCKRLRAGAPEPIMVSPENVFSPSPAVPPADDRTPVPPGASPLRPYAHAESFLRHPNRADRRAGRRAMDGEPAMPLINIRAMRCWRVGRGPHCPAV